MPICLLATSVTADWTHWGGDAASTKFAPYDQIHAGNVDSLKILWRYRVPGGVAAQSDDDDDEGLSSAGYKGTPIVVDGVLYTFAPLGYCVALDAATGRELWRFDAGGREDDSTGQFNNRGVAYWTDGSGQARILFGTWADTLYSLDARTGLPDPAFGVNGRVDLTLGLRGPVDPEDFGLSSPPTVVGDVVVVGSVILDWHSGGSPPEYTSPGGVRAYDVRTGQQLWRFNTIPQPGEFGWTEWQGNSWDQFGSANVWGTMSADADLGIVYLPVSSVSHDRYGGERPGRNLFSDCLVALDARTGERLWHYQLIHHTLWNYDPPAAPILLDVTIDGRPRKIVVQLTKQAFAYVFDRVTGEPIWPIEERAAPQSTVPGEQTWPTQPFPTKPAAFDRQGLTEEDLIDFTPELRQEALEIISKYDTGPLYTPPSLEGAIQLPGELGGTDWVGGSADPASGVLFVPSKTLPDATVLQQVADTTAFSAFGGRRQSLSGPQGLPLTKPPYGRITAIDLNTGDHLWMRPVGKGPIEHPALSDVAGLPQELGWPGRTFLLTTPELLFATTEHPGSFTNLGDGYFIDRDATLQVYDKATGELVTKIPLPDNTWGGLISYEADGRQYIAATLGGDTQPAEIVALAIPRAGEDVGPQAWEGYAAEHPRFEDAVARIDAGDAAGLDSLLKAHPGLAKARGYLNDLYPIPALRGAQLVHLVPGSERARLPANVMDLFEILLEHGADAAALTADSTSVLDLLVTSDQLDWMGTRGDLLSSALRHGAKPGPQLMWLALVGTDPKWRGLSEDHFQLSHDLHAAGVPVDLPFAAALGLVDEMAGFFGEDGELLPSANTQYRPYTSGGVSDQDILDMALGYAAYGGQRSAVDWLLERGADIDAMPQGFFRGFAAQGGGIAAIHKAVYANDVDMIRHLAARGADLLLLDGNFGGPPIGWANILSREEATAVLQELLAVGAQDFVASEASDEPWVATVLTAPGSFPVGVEGPAVDAEGNLYAVNFATKGTIGRVTPEGDASLFVTLPEGSTGNGIRFDASGDMLIADYTGHNILRVDMSTKVVSVHAHEPRMNQPNDLAIGADGTLYASDPDWARGTGQLWRIGLDGTVTRLETGMGTTNGIEVSPGEDRLYVNESVQRKVWVYDLSSEGALSNKRLFISFDEDGMDGMRCDVEGNLYIARHGRGTIAVISPAGKLLREVDLTGRLPSNIAFGGPDGRTAYVTLQNQGNIETFRVEHPGRSWKLRH
jgi:quinoprotein glucose dehydrogenase